jgi:dethiobiotin synthetase
VKAGYFITGTDTGVGKTLIACAILRHFARQGRRVAGMKPIAAGTSAGAGVWRNDDVAALAAASTVKVEREDVNPYCFELPVAPHIGADEASIVIDITVIERSFASLRAVADIVVVEGVGGFLVPLNAREDGADLAARLDLPVILVVGMRLGCLSHALLTAEAIAARGLRLGGWVANCIDPKMAKAEENLAALRERIDAPLLGKVPFLSRVDAELAAKALDLDPLAAMARE